MPTLSFQQGAPPLLCRSLVFTICMAAFSVALPYSRNGLEFNAVTRSVNTKTGCLAQPKLVCQLEPTTGFAVRGTVTFSPQFWEARPYGERCGVLVSARATGLTKGLHGFHIHQYGDIRRSHGKLAGGHFTSPSGLSVFHGLPTDSRHHWGDLGNLMAWGGGRAAYHQVHFTLRLTPIVGRSIVVHASEDKGASFQPSGDAGARQAHCVIGYASPKLPLL